MAEVDTATRAVLVTGGSRGIGQAVVRMLAAGDHPVRFTYRQSEDAAKVLLDDLRARHPGKEFSAHKVDLADREQVDALADFLAGDDPLHGLVHCAGQSYDSLAATLDQDRAEALMQVNFWSLTRLVKGAIRPMLRARAGRIVAIGSITAVRGMAGNATYAATKGAMMAYIRTLAVEVARKNVTVNYIAPGYVDTDMMAPYAEYRDKVEAQLPLGRFAAADEIAGLVRYLLSTESGYVTGSVYTIDGGLSAALAVSR